jgi:hypothetical protein
VVNVSPEAEIDGLSCTADHFLQKSLKRLGVKGRISTDELAAGLPHIHYAFKIQRGVEKKTKEMKALSPNCDEWFRSNNCVMLKMRWDKSFMTLLRKALVHFQVNYAKDVFSAKSLIVPAKTRCKPSAVDKF